MKINKIGLLSLVATLFFSLQSFGAINVLMKFEGLDVPKDFRTKSQIDGFNDGWATIYGVSSGFSVDVGTPSSRRVGQPAYQDFSVVRLADELSPSLILAGAKGTVITKVIIAWVSAGGSTKPAKVMEFIMEDVFVSSSSISASQGEESGTESVSFNWGKMTINSFTQDSKGVSSGPATSVVLDAVNNTAGK